MPRVSDWHWKADNFVATLQFEVAHIRVADVLELCDNLVDGCQVIIAGHEVQRCSERSEFFLSQLHPLAHTLAHFVFEAGGHLGWIAFQFLRFILLQHDGIEAHLADRLLDLFQFLGRAGRFLLAEPAGLCNVRPWWITGIIAFPVTSPPTIRTFALYWMPAARNLRKTASEPWKSEPYRMRVSVLDCADLPNFINVLR